jgi:hypothetical protein
MIDLGKWIGGPDEGDGIVGSILGLFGGAALVAGGAGGAAEAVGGHGVADGFGATAGRAAAGFEHGGAAAEGLFGRIFHEFTATDWAFWGDFLGSGRAKQAFTALSENVKSVAIGHGFMLQQLRANHHKEDVAALLADYEALGNRLPPVELQQKVYRKLSFILHPDKNGGQGDALMKELSKANATLNDLSKRTEYEAMLAGHAESIEEIIKGFAEAHPDWQKKTTEQTAERIRKGLLLEGDAAKIEAESENWFAKMSAGKKGALIIGSVAAISVGAYLTLKSLSAKNKKNHPEDEKFMGNLPGPILRKHPIERINKEEKIAAAAR